MHPDLRGHLPRLRTAAQAEPLGLYLHVPFCVDRCTYCSFTTTRDRTLQVATVQRLLADIAAWGEALGRPAVDTLYLGGGTPSLLSQEELTALTVALGSAFDLSPLVEATLEANPGTVDLGWLQAAHLRQNLQRLEVHTGLGRPLPAAQRLRLRQRYADLEQAASPAQPPWRFPREVARLRRDFLQVMVAP